MNITFLNLITVFILWEGRQAVWPLLIKKCRQENKLVYCMWLAICLHQKHVYVSVLKHGKILFYRICIILNNVMFSICREEHNSTFSCYPCWILSSRYIKHSIVLTVNRFPKSKSINSAVKLRIYKWSYFIYIQYFNYNLMTATSYSMPECATIYMKKKHVQWIRVFTFGFVHTE